MSKSLHVDLHKLANFVNIALPLSVGIFAIAGELVSFYFHFLTVAAFFLSLVNGFYLLGQKEHTLLRNFGILGQGRYLLESIGPELRQYLLSNDREERPFDRQVRSEVYRKAKNIDSASSFGSQDAFDASEIKIRHSMFPASKERLEPFSLIYGEERGLETAYTIQRPIMISAMSFGALGERAVRSLARGAKLAGIPMNTGEGGYPKYHLMEGCDLIFQIGTTKFGVRDEEGLLDDAKLRSLASMEQIKMIEIKLSQGAKPGKGGLLPKEKITAEISELRGVPLGSDVVSPTFHPECSSPSATVQFIKRVQDVSGLPVGIKLCLSSPEEFTLLVCEMKLQEVFPDFITLDGAEGGTGAAPKAFLDKVGTPLLDALWQVNSILEREGVRGRLKLNASGKLVTPASQMLAFALGADAVYTARGFMMALGCIQALQCGNNTCPIGITTHDPRLQKGIDIGSKALRVKNFVDNVEHDLEELLASTGKTRFNDLNTENLHIPKLSQLSGYVEEALQVETKRASESDSLISA
ncbi:FMN-binding glutamate synthase family protein [Pelagicoccus sp. SDUM812003]|uniref:FMN-binding glutamate synthase family protein n=1 Tax=Pelagicoccus sp. SDUM812003 TaxID=3041267 RepID=UPI00280E0C51|nr:FMN-binding glutamate synthase family protein [Pelagicoccus sp. SDUM812003]MDQ8202207.1 FMN-binding glutamate synthase family protein [Pelagicoccus sp. SDUM812003]